MNKSLTRTTSVERTPRFVQTRDKFSIESDGTSTAAWDVDVVLPDAWSVGLIVGESGAGKTTLARHLLAAGGLDGLLVTPRDEAGRLVEPFDWPMSRCVVDGFPESMGINDVVGLMSSVGFSSPPAWLRPFSTLSIGEQFRATMARALAECESRRNNADGNSASPPVAVIDEFANAVDSTTAKIGSAATAKSVRARGLRLIAVTTREDVGEWLEPDWVIPMRRGEPVRLARGSLRRPDLRLESTARVPRLGRSFVTTITSTTGSTRLPAATPAASMTGPPASPPSSTGRRPKASSTASTARSASRSSRASGSATA